MRVKEAVGGVAPARRWAVQAVSALTLGLLVLAGCAAAGSKAGRSGKPSEKFIPMQLQRSFFCESVTREGAGEPRPSADLSSIATSAKQVVSVVELANVLDKHTVRFKWYDPDGELYLDSDDSPLIPPGEFHRRLVVWHPMRIAGEKASALPGKWKVVVTLDTAIVATRELTLTARSSD
ncbi:MAG: hypothetical protein HYV63_09335 [Candidatus Schekmanbacteria bacterium]|nr:hypothetical protein [Candidatus Schekmanbacteria bacterium]